MLQIQKTNCLIFIIFCFQLSFSQEKVAQKDSLEVYKNIQNYSKKHKFTKFVHKLVFKPINPKQILRKKVVRQNYQAFEGKIIRNINIITLDPFGYSEIDSTKKPRNWVEKNGNSIHIKTKKLAIQNVLLIRENKPFDSLLVKESVRLIRTQSYINRVVITPQLITKNGDSVDIYIRVLDTWSFLPKASFSNSKGKIQLNERNFFGLGHTLNSQYQKRYDDGNNASNLEYIIPNIKNTFIKTAVLYNKDLDDNYGKSITIDRPFYSPFAKWAGGINLNQQFRSDTLTDSNLVYAKQRFKYNSQEFWGGYAFRISKDSTENSRITNLIVSGRFFNVNYIESPTIAYDPIDFYSSEQFFLSGIGISTRKYVEDRYVFKNGIIEDVPIGKIYGITAGYQSKNNNQRFYLGGQASFGNYFKWGFLSLNFELGTFFNKLVTNQTAFSFQANYFTNLIDIGKWKVRQFIKPQLTIGINRQNSIGDQLTINENNGIKGFKSAIYGNQKMILTFQTQTYSPWKVFGFRLNPYFNYTIAMLGNEKTSLRDNQVFSKIGIGFQITNDYLVFRTFQISLAYYPTIPSNGNNVLKTNSFETSDFGFQDFGLDKPRTVIYK
ncbi:hypothetical protein FNW17_07390 [Flavobacterium franklandianum]|uniref:POTRA domain-containing protein n=1 Tax=Flavobacterium franklandianum TaxID=2594430 RepID=A0A553CMH4_9FLAO|nr:hypothetical protein FNW17_07390 [Flavobacterium franklandianum]